MPVWWDQLIPVSCRLTIPRNAAAWMTIPVRRSAPFRDFQILWVRAVKGITNTGWVRHFKGNGMPSGYRCRHDWISSFDEGLWTPTQE